LILILKKIKKKSLKQDGIGKLYDFCSIGLHKLTCSVIGCWRKKSMIWSFDELVNHFQIMTSMPKPLVE